MREVGNFDYFVNMDSPSNEILQIWDAEVALQEITDTIDSRENYTVGIFLESLRLDIYLPSFDKAPFPEVYPEDTVAERNRKLMEVEQRAPKTGLAFYRKRASETDWHYLSEIILQNRGRRTQIPVVVPYFTTNQLKMLSRDTQLGVEKVNYGNGVIGGGPIVSNRLKDKVYLEGDFRIDIDQSEFKRRRRVSGQYDWTVRDSPVPLLFQNPNRAFFEIQNNGNQDLWLDFNFSTDIYSPIVVRPQQLYYPQVEPVVTQTIYAKCPNNETIVTILEFEYY